ncbi:alcohol acetyltransferase [Flagelloscypha sp. PMI_526]|nr:alcohol acetyltransferase [Flagelloscypha sp. PMI_526]
MASESSLRPLGYLERWHLSRSCSDFDTCVVLSAKYSNNGAPLAYAALLDAMRRVVHVHPAMRATILDPHGSSPTFALIPEPSLVQDLSTFVVESSLTPNEIFFQKELQTQIELKEAYPLWRVKLLTDGTVCFSWNHSVGDGLSGVAFHATLLQALQDLSSDPLKPLPPQRPFHDAIDTLVDVRPGFFLIFKNVLQLFLPPSWFNRGTYTGSLIPATTGVTPRVRILKFPTDICKQLLSLSKKHHVSLTAFLLEVATSALATHLQGRTAVRILPTSVAVSHRPRTKVPATDFCDHVSGLHFARSLDPLFSWKEAQKVNMTLKANPFRDGEVIGLLKYLFGKYDSYWKGRLGKKRGACIGLSNLGVVRDVVEDGSSSWTVDDFMFVQNGILGGPPFEFGVVTSPSGSLTVLVRWGTEVVEDEMAQAVCETFKSRLEELANKA